MKLKIDNHQEPEGGFGPGISVWLYVLAALLFLAVAGVYAFSFTSSGFAFYDDEGFLMITVRGYLEGHPLYDGVLTAYGPFYYLYEWMVHTAACLPLTHDLTRILCILHWLAASAILAVAGGLMTRSRLPALFIFMQATVHLRHLACEPGHPQEVVILLLALAALVAARDWKRPWMMPLLGGIGAACALTKINVGAFFGLAGLLALVCHSPFFQARRPWFWGLLGFMGVLPFVLMRQHLAESWARDYSAQVSAAILAAGALAYVFAGERTIGFRHWVQTGTAFACVSGIVIGVVLVQGSSFQALLDSLVVGPSKLGSLFCIPLRPSNSLCSGGAALCLAAIVVFWRGPRDRLRLPIAVAKGIYGIVGALVMATDVETQLGLLLPWAWLAVVRDQEDPRPGHRETFGRAFVCLMAVWQGLQAYPVAGTQVSTGTFPLILIFSLCLHDAIKAFAGEPWTRRQWRTLPPRTSALVQVLVLTSMLYLFVVEWCRPLALWRTYVSVPSLGLPGARYLRLDEYQSQKYRALAEYLRTQCDTFVVIPGLNSLYFWAGKTPPTYFNICGEGVMPSDRQQDQIVAALRRAKRPLVVESEIRWPSWIRVGDAKAGPLPLFIANEYREVARLADFRILAPKNAIGHQSASSY